jgi:hypothetical protein
LMGRIGKSSGKARIGLLGPLEDRLTTSGDYLTAAAFTIQEGYQSERGERDRKWLQGRHKKLLARRQEAGEDVLDPIDAGALIAVASKAGDKLPIAKELLNDVFGVPVEVFHQGNEKIMEAVDCGLGIMHSTTLALVRFQKAASKWNERAVEVSWGFNFIASWAEKETGAVSPSTAQFMVPCLEPLEGDNEGQNRERMEKAAAINGGITYLAGLEDQSARGKAFKRMIARGNLLSVKWDLSMGMLSSFEDNAWNQLIQDRAQETLRVGTQIRMMFRRSDDFKSGKRPLLLLPVRKDLDPLVDETFQLFAEVASRENPLMRMSTPEGVVWVGIGEGLGFEGLKEGLKGKVYEPMLAGRSGIFRGRKRRHSKMDLGDAEMTLNVMGPEGVDGLLRGMHRAMTTGVLPTPEAFSPPQELVDERDSCLRLVLQSGRTLQAPTQIDFEAPLAGMTGLRLSPIPKSGGDLRVGVSFGDHYHYSFPFDHHSEAGYIAGLPGMDVGPRLFLETTVLAHLGELLKPNLSRDKKEEAGKLVTDKRRIPLTEPEAQKRLSGGVHLRALPLGQVPDLCRDRVEKAEATLGVSVEEADGAFVEAQLDLSRLDSRSDEDRLSRALREGTIGKLKRIMATKPGEPRALCFRIQDKGEPRRVARIGLRNPGGAFEDLEKVKGAIEERVRVFDVGPIKSTDFEPRGIFAGMKSVRELVAFQNDLDRGRAGVGLVQAIPTCEEAGVVYRLTPVFESASARGVQKVSCPAVLARLRSFGSEESS